MNDGSGDKKAKETKKCVIKRIIKIKDYKNCLQNNRNLLTHSFPMHPFSTPLKT